jgi:hypothetical protein
MGKEKKVEADGDASPTLVLPSVNKRFALAPKTEKNASFTTYNEPMVVVKSPRRIKQRSFAKAHESRSSKAKLERLRKPYL